MKLRAVATVALLVALAGCSSSAPPASTSSAMPPSTGAATTAAPTQSATRTDDSASLRQYGSLVAGSEGPVRAAIKKYGPCTPFDFGPSSPECTLEPLGVDFAIQKFLTDLSSGRAQIGKPPAELASLIQTTRADAVRAERLAKNSDKGPALRLRMKVAFSALVDDLNSWKPYTH